MTDGELRTGIEELRDGITRSEARLRARFNKSLLDEVNAMKDRLKSLSDEATRRGLRY